MDYSDIGKKEYGTACEFNKCAWNEATCDVHHINYKEQHKMEIKIREAFFSNQKGDYEKLINEAREKGFLYYDQKKRQLAKDDRITNLCVLCPNHHRYVHHVDMGMDILKFIPERK